MLLRKTNNYSHVKQVKYYQRKTIPELKTIIPKWAYGENSDKLFDISQHPHFGNYSIFFVDVADLIKTTQLNGFNPEILFTGDLASDSRVATTLHQWENNGFIDPPTISISDQFPDKLSISDGRHRTKLTYLLAEKQIPIAINNSLIDKIGKIISLILP